MEIEPATFRLVSQRLDQGRHRVPPFKEHTAQDIILKTL
jgi:hypothetical protein